ncbi:MAG TPA: heme-binding protein [Xanthobacteraceae bacterium]|nr:heme-binding protein [Xanthobacteraceae bacterium]
MVEAKTCAAAAAAHAADIGVPMVIAVTDAAGQLLYLERMDGAIAAGIQVAQDKARCAALYKRATKVFEDALLSPNGQRFMSLAGVVPVEGGVILIRNGQLVGAIGVSGGTGHQDGQVAQAGASALAA